MQLGQGVFHREPFNGPLVFNKQSMRVEWWWWWCGCVGGGGGAAAAGGGGIVVAMAERVAKSCSHFSTHPFARKSECKAATHNQFTSGVR